ncbi:MAG: Do family serine endopeptidase [Fibrobacteria bacterium]|nr:Do family serine endopeptidase [Fibrobacteria bacterium]
MKSTFLIIKFSLILVMSFSLGSCNDLKGKIDDLAKLDSDKEKTVQGNGTGKESESTGPSIISAKEQSDKVVAVVKKVMPSVVSVHSEKIIEVHPRQYFNPFEDFFHFFDRPFNDPFHNNRRYQQPKPEPRKHKQQGLGSGVIVSKEGHVITNHHVAGEADNIQLTLPDEREFSAEVVGSDKMSDIAVLKIKDPPDDLPVAEMGNSDELDIGETVIAIGSPFGYSNTVTKGIISAKGRAVGLNSYENYLQTDASINPGNSGGALINLEGELVGINTAIASRTGASHGIGFAIPINMAKEIMDDLMDKGHVERGYLGVYLQDVDQNLANALGLDNGKGALVTSVIEDSPAKKAGFKESDVILKIDGKKVKNVNEARNKVALLQPKKKYSFKILREGKELTLKVKMGKREEDEKVGSRDKKSGDLGLSLENVTQNHVQRYRLNVNTGVVVTYVEAGSPADNAGIAEGDIILQVGRETISDPGNFKKAIKKAGKSTVLILADRRGRKMYLGLNIK